MHMIPASADIERKLKALHAGSSSNCRATLVEVDAADGWRWRSSLTREDTGAGACELIWVSELQIL